MGTIMFLITLLSLTVLAAQLDAIIYQTDLFTQFFSFYSLELGTSKWMVTGFLFVGFLHTVVSGIKQKFKKSRNKA